MITSFTNDGSTAYTAGNTILNVNTWTHVAVVYDGSSLSMYKDGTRFYGPTSMAISNKTGNLYIGMAYPTAELFQGYMDEVRITKGVARYSGASFTVPALAAPTQ